LLHRFLSGRYDVLGLWGWRWNRLIVDELEDRRGRGRLRTTLFEGGDCGEILLGHRDDAPALGGELRRLGLRPEHEDVRALRARRRPFWGPQVALSADDSKLLLHRAKTEGV
jgi:hypothetical protein